MLTMRYYFLFDDIVMKENGIHSSRMSIGVVVVVIAVVVIVVVVISISRYEFSS